jgi:hypothetical protein
MYYLIAKKGAPIWLGRPIITICPRIDVVTTGIIDLIE